jgi:hypothetical protein
MSLANQEVSQMTILKHAFLTLEEHRQKLKATFVVTGRKGSPNRTQPELIESISAHYFADSLQRTDVIGPLASSRTRTQSLAMGPVRQVITS